MMDFNIVTCFTLSLNNYNRLVHGNKLFFKSVFQVRLKKLIEIMIYFLHNIFNALCKMCKLNSEDTSIDKFHVVTFFN